MSLIDIPLQDLESLGMTELRQAWAQHYITAVPARISPELLRLSLGYKLQEAIFGGLSRKTLLQLSATKFDPETGQITKTSTPGRAPKPGTKFIREWRGKVHEVSVLDDGQFAYNECCYASLTVIARQITGTHQSGPRFFGIKAKVEAKVNGSNSRA